MEIVRGKNINSEDIKAGLPTTQFVIADVGIKLKWIDEKETYIFWKEEAQKHIVDNVSQIDLKNYPDNYSYLASEWVGDANYRIVLLEKVH